MCASQINRARSDPGSALRWDAAGVLLFREPGAEALETPPRCGFASWLVGITDLARGSHTCLEFLFSRRIRDV